MKPTPKNIECLKMMGCTPEGKDLTAWWRFDCGWAFVLDNMPSIKVLITRLIKWHYSCGYNEAKEGHPRFYKNTEV